MMRVLEVYLPLNCIIRCSGSACIFNACILRHEHNLTSYLQIKLMGIILGYSYVYMLGVW